MKTRTTGMKLGLGALALGVWVAAQAAAPVITNITIVGGTPQFRIQSDLGITNQIQYSTNLGQTNWTVLTNIAVAASPYLVMDVAAPPAPYRFYRVAALYQTNNPVPPGMALIPAGSFTMGDTFNEGGSDELPLHSVYVSAFYMDKYNVTKALWDEVYSWAVEHGYSFDYADSGQGKAANHPVQTVSWYDCVKWCNARSEKENKTPAYYTDAGLSVPYRSGQTDVQNDWVNWSSGYRLPTEAEWEKAARGGASGLRFPWGNTISWSRANYNAYPLSAGGFAYDVNPRAGYHPTFDDGVEPYTSPVGRFAPNGYGLYDMAGNVWNWCWDGYGGYSESMQTDPRGPTVVWIRVLRGGSWEWNGAYCRSAGRYYLYPTKLSVRIGFRSVLPSCQ